jgi:hypothetical protein
MGTPRRPSPPRLSYEEVGNDQQLGLLVDQVIHHDRKARRGAQRIVTAQSGLKAKTSKGAWQAYLAIEETMTARWADLAVVIARWAFTEGRSAGQRQGGA